MENFFRALKSGCRTELLLFRTAARLQRAVAINAVIAWRIMAMTLLGRQAPDCEPELMFTGHELDFLTSYAEEHGLLAPDRLATPCGSSPISADTAPPQARSGPRASGHAARPDEAGKRGDEPPDRLQGRPEACLSGGRKGCRDA